MEKKELAKSLGFPSHDDYQEANMDFKNGLHQKAGEEDWEGKWDRNFANGLKDPTESNVYKLFIQTQRAKAKAEGFKEAVEQAINLLEMNPNSDGSISPNIHHWIEAKQRQFKQSLLEKGSKNERNN